MTSQNLQVICYILTTNKVYQTILHQIDGSKKYIILFLTSKLHIPEEVTILK